MTHYSKFSHLGEVTTYYNVGHDESKESQEKKRRQRINERD